MTIDELIANAREVEFTDLESIRKLARGAVVMPESGSSEDRLGSRLGGLPTLPPAMPWPRHQGRSLAFIGQVELATLPTIASQEGLPREGLLLFFYDAEQSTWGFDPKDAGSFAVIYVPDPAAASIVTGWPADLPAHARYRACSLEPEETATLPPWDSVLIDDLNLDQRQVDAYLALLERPSVDETLLCGYPDPIQGDMMVECAAVSGGLYCGNTSANKDPRMPVFRQSARDWRLLLQVPSAKSAGMMWGDLGCLYYCIREQDLRASHFERSWMILQCG